MIDSLRLNEIHTMSHTKLAHAKRGAVRILNNEYSPDQQKQLAQKILEQVVIRESQLERAHLDACIGNSVLFKKCSICEREKPIDNSYFGFGLKPNGQPKARCKACYRKNSEVYYSGNLDHGREKSRANHERRRDEDRGTITNDQKQILRYIQGNACAYCGDDLGTEGELDHYIPVERGGTHVITNRVWACRSCNRDKGRKLPAEYLTERESHGLKVRRTRSGEGYFFKPKLYNL